MADDANLRLTLLTARGFPFRECTRGGFCNFMHLRPISRELKTELYNRDHPWRQLYAKSRSGSAQSATVTKKRQRRSSGNAAADSSDQSPTSSSSGNSSEDSSSDSSSIRSLPKPYRRQLKLLRRERKRKRNERRSSSSDSSSSRSSVDSVLKAVMAEKRSKINRLAPSL